MVLVLVLELLAVFFIVVILLLALLGLSLVFILGVVDCFLLKFFLQLIMALFIFFMLLLSFFMIFLTIVWETWVRFLQQKVSKLIHCVDSMHIEPVVAFFLQDLLSRSLILLTYLSLHSYINLVMTGSKVGFPQFHSFTSLSSRFLQLQIGHLLGIMDGWGSSIRLGGGKTIGCLLGILHLSNKINI